MEIKFYIPFGGFYDSLHSWNIDDRIEQEAHTSDEDIDYEKTKESYCEEYVNCVNSELDLNIKYEGISSPKYYNFETDKIEASITKKDFDKWKDILLEEEELKEYIEEASKSRDGFRSFYSGWDAVEACDEIFLEYVFQWYHSQENFERDVLEHHEFELHFKDTLPKEFIPR